MLLHPFNRSSRNVMSVGFIMVFSTIFVSLITYIISFRSLYADGSAFFYNVLSSKNYFIPNPGRIVTYWISQFLEIVYLNFGLSNISLAEYLQTAGETGIPLCFYAMSLFLSLRSRFLFSASIIMITSVFYPSALFHLGEFHFLYSLAWLITICLVRNSTLSLAVCMVASVLTIQVYEANIFIALMVILISASLIWRERDSSKRIVLVMIVAFQTLAVFSSTATAFSPTLASANGQFRSILSHPDWSVGTYLIFAFSVICTAVSLLYYNFSKSLHLVLFIALAISVYCLIATLNGGLPSFGIAYNQRVVGLLITLSLMMAVYLVHIFPGARYFPQQWISPFSTLSPLLLVLIPVATAFSLDLRSTIGWSEYLDQFCISINDPSSNSASFLEMPIVKQYGWVWTNSHMSAILRRAGSHAVFDNPDPIRFPTPASVVDLSGFKVRSQICHRN